MLDPKLETLLAVAEHRNFTRAAQALGLTQPAVSHHIGLLEKQLGIKLFLRGNSAFELTPEGEIAVRYALRLKALYQAMCRDLRDRRRQMTHIRVGLTHTSESNTITEMLARYSTLNNHVSITIITDTIKNLYARLANFEIDIAVVEGTRLPGAFNYPPPASCSRPPSPALGRPSRISTSPSRWTISPPSRIWCARVWGSPSCPRAPA